MKKAVEMKNISYSYSSLTGENKVLDGVDFSLEYGKITLIAGGSGSGKSTLFYIMNGVIPNNYSGKLSGEVLVKGEDIKGKSIGEISKKIASVFQNAEEQIIQKYVKDEIAFGMENLGKTQEEIQKNIAFYTDLLDLNKEDVTLTLSGGQKQRLVTASILALQNDIIILDEPLANLDKKSAHILMQTLTKLKNQGKAICIIEHRLDMVINYADTVFNLENGKLVEEENKEQFLSKHITKLDDICPEFSGNQTLLDIKNISYKHIITDMNFTINKGERVLILGDNGSGKTTITKIIARLLKQNSGEIVQNIDKKMNTKKWFKKVSYVFQNPNYQLFMPTVEDELLFACHSTKYAQKISDMFGLEPLLDFHPHALSQGQKRKLSVATMLAVKPEVIILDEPTVGQDYDSLKILVNNINKIHKEENNTVLTITHDIRCANALCDKAIIIENGKIIKTGGKELAREYLSNK
ncbi:MAG: ATP-binding cassette domain-containing protein [Clostridia bacterium]